MPTIECVLANAATRWLSEFITEKVFTTPGGKEIKMKRRLRKNLTLTVLENGKPMRPDLHWCSQAIMNAYTRAQAGMETVAQVDTDPQKKKIHECVYTGGTEQQRLDFHGVRKSRVKYLAKRVERSIVGNHKVNGAKFWVRLEDTDSLCPSGYRPDPNSALSPVYSLSQYYIIEMYSWWKATKRRLCKTFCNRKFVGTITFVAAGTAIKYFSELHSLIGEVTTVYGVLMFLSGIFTNKAE